MTDVFSYFSLGIGDPDCVTMATQVLETPVKAWLGLPHEQDWFPADSLALLMSKPSSRNIVISSVSILHKLKAVSDSSMEINLALCRYIFLVLGDHGLYVVYI